MGRHVHLGSRWHSPTFETGPYAGPQSDGKSSGRKLALSPMAARAFGDDHRRHEHAKSPTRAGVRASGRRADLSHRSCTAGQPCRRTSFAQILGGSPSGAQRRLVPAGCGRVARDRRAAAWACIGVASRRRALLRGRSSPNRNSARRWSRVRALRANVSGGPIESHASHSPCVRGLVAQDPRPAVPKCRVTCGGRHVRQ